MRLPNVFARHESLLIARLSTNVVGWRMKVFAAAAGQLLVLSILLRHDLLSLRQQRLSRFWIGAGERPIAQLVIGIIFERDRGPGRVEPEWSFTNLAHGRIEAEKRPVSAGRRKVLLLHTEAQVEAVSDAMAIGDNERRARIGLGLAEGEQRVLRISSHRHLCNINVTVGNGLQRQVLSRYAFAGGSELRDRSQWRCLG